jgi:outer membrane protein assembly factor BamB
MFRKCAIALAAGLVLASAVVAAAPTKAPTGYTGAATDWYGGGAKMDPGDWPQWRGPTRDGVSTETNLLDKWPEDGPPLAWKLTGLGQGLATPITYKGRLYIPGEKQGTVYLQCFDLATQKPIWRCAIPGDKGDPGASPTIDGDALFGQAHDGTNYCVGLDGQLRWTKSNTRDFGGGLMNPQYQFAQTPLVDGDRVVVNPGGKDACVVALNRKDGSVIWKIPASETGGNQPRAAFSSAVITEGGGLKHYVFLVGDGLIGIRPKDGKVLWTFNNHRGEANIPTPSVRGDYVFCCNSYGGGTVLLKLSPDGAEGVKAEKIYYRSGDDYQNLCGGSVVVGDYAYTGTGGYSANPHCYKLATGEIVWQHGQVGTGVAGLTYADGKLFFRAEGGQVSMIAATPQGYQLLGAFTYKAGGNYSHPVVSHGLLLTRQNDELRAYDIRKK